MASVYVIGLPRALRRRLEAEATRNQIRVISTLADAGLGNQFKIIPYPGQALSDLQQFADAEQQWDKLTIVVLPYAPVSVEVIGELEVLIAGGAKVIGLSTDNSLWPALTLKIDDQFLDSVFEAIAKILFPPRILLPSEHFRRLAQRNERLILIDGSLNECDFVAQERYAFMISVANAFEKIVKKNHLGERIYTFLQDLGLDLAQTGGINTQLTLKRKNKILYDQSASAHVKLGDGLAPQMCARVYFHHCFIDDASHIAVMYAGLNRPGFRGGSNS